jgi:hypothetical protein
VYKHQAISGRPSLLTNLQCNAIQTPCSETTARLYDYADDAKDEKKKYTKMKYWVIL